MPDGTSPWQYRNIALFSVGPNGEVGFKLTESHEVQDLEECALLHPALDRVYQLVRNKLMKYFGDSLSEMIQGFTIRGAIGTANTSGGINTAKAVPTLLSIHARPGSLIEAPQQLAHELITIAPGIVGVIVERVGGRYGRVVAGQEFLTDSILGRRFRVSTDSFFQVNLLQTGVLIERAMQMLEPHRTGCHPKALQALQILAPRNICYVSCDPSTLARDIATLCSGGRYRLVAAQPVDMFPQTYHIECLALLARVGNH